MNIKELLHLCANSAATEFPTLNCVTLVWGRGLGRFPFRGKGVELLNEMPDRSVYSVDIEVILRAVAKIISDQRRAAYEKDIV